MKCPRCETEMMMVNGMYLCTSYECTEAKRLASDRAEEIERLEDELIASQKREIKAIGALAEMRDKCDDLKQKLESADTENANLKRVLRKYADTGNWESAGTFKGEKLGVYLWKGWYYGIEGDPWEPAFNILWPSKAAAIATQPNANSMQTPDKVK